MLSYLYLCLTFPRYFIIVFEQGSYFMRVTEKATLIRTYVFVLIKSALGILEPCFEEDAQVTCLRSSGQGLHCLTWLGAAEHEHGQRRALHGAGVVRPGLVALEILLGDVIIVVSRLPELHHEIQIRNPPHLPSSHLARYHKQITKNSSIVSIWLLHTMLYNQKSPLSCVPRMSTWSPKH